MNVKKYCEKNTSDKFCKKVDELEKEKDDIKKKITVIQGKIDTNRDNVRSEIIKSHTDKCDTAKLTKDCDVAVNVCNSKAFKAVCSEENIQKKINSIKQAVLLNAHNECVDSHNALKKINEIKSEAKPETKPEAEAETKPEAEAEAKPEAEAEEGKGQVGGANKGEIKKKFATSCGKLKKLCENPSYKDLCEEDSDYKAQYDTTAPLIEKANKENTKDSIEFHAEQCLKNKKGDCRRLKVLCGRENNKVNCENDKAKEALNKLKNAKEEVDTKKIDIEAQNCIKGNNKSCVKVTKLCKNSDYCKSDDFKEQNEKIKGKVINIVNKNNTECGKGQMKQCNRIIALCKNSGYCTGDSKTAYDNAVSKIADKFSVKCENGNKKACIILERVCSLNAEYCEKKGFNKLF